VEGLGEKQRRVVLEPPFHFELGLEAASEKSWTRSVGAEQGDEPLSLAGEEECWESLEH
jgi:hypothetical protein